MYRIWSIAALLVLIQGCQSTPDENNNQNHLCLSP